MIGSKIFTIELEDRKKIRHKLLQNLSRPIQKISNSTGTARSTAIKRYKNSLSVDKCLQCGRKQGPVDQELEKKPIKSLK